MRPGGERLGEEADDLVAELLADSEQRRSSSGMARRLCWRRGRRARGGWGSRAWPLGRVGAAPAAATGGDGLGRPQQGGAGMAGLGAPAAGGARTGGQGGNGEREEGDGVTSRRGRVLARGGGKQRTSGASGAEHRSPGCARSAFVRQDMKVHVNFSHFS